jgi:K+-sensing histidine kinase KdpD
MGPAGVGIDPRNLWRLFDAFVSTKSKGIGPGLAIARSIVGNHGGRLWATRNEDQGASVQFELPVKDTTAPPDSARNVSVRRRRSRAL